MNGEVPIWFTFQQGMTKGVYPQNEGSLAIVGIDASKGFVDLWVHFFVAIVDIHRNGYRQKVLSFGFD